MVVKLDINQIKTATQHNTYEIKIKDVLQGIPDIFEGNSNDNHDQGEEQFEDEKG